MGQILARYVGADSVGGSPPDAKTADNSTNSSELDWYNMTCPRCPWFVDGERTGQYTIVNDDTNDDTNAAAGDTAGDDADAPDNASVTWNDADGDSGRVAGDDTPLDEGRDELLDGLEAKCDNNKDVMGLGEPSGGRRVPIVQCVRPEAEECLNESFCVRLLVAGDLVRQQAALRRMMAGLAPGVDSAGVEDEVAGITGKKLTAKAKRNQKLRRASKKRGR